MTNEEIAVTCYTSIRSRDAADRARERWGCGVCRQAPQPVERKADIFRVRKKISDRSPFYWRRCRKGREGVSEAKPETLPRGDELELDPMVAR